MKLIFKTLCIFATVLSGAVGVSTFAAETEPAVGDTVMYRHLKFITGTVSEIKPNGRAVIRRHLRFGTPDIKEIEDERYTLKAEGLHRNYVLTEKQLNQILFFEAPIDTLIKTESELYVGEDLPAITLGSTVKGEGTSTEKLQQYSPLARINGFAGELVGIFDRSNDIPEVVLAIKDPQSGAVTSYSLWQNNFSVSVQDVCQDLML